MGQEGKEIAVLPFRSLPARQESFQQTDVLLDRGYDLNYVWNEIRDRSGTRLPTKSGSQMTKNYDYVLRTRLRRTPPRDRNDKKCRQEPFRDLEATNVSKDQS